jgi:hypothetical protein
MLIEHATECAALLLVAGGAEDLKVLDRRGAAH